MYFELLATSDKITCKFKHENSYWIKIALNLDDERNVRVSSRKRNSTGLKKNTDFQFILIRIKVDE